MLRRRDAPFQRPQLVDRDLDAADLRAARAPPRRRPRCRLAPTCRSRSATAPAAARRRCAGRRRAWPREAAPAGRWAGSRGRGATSKPSMRTRTSPLPRSANGVAAPAVSKRLPSSVKARRGSTFTSRSDGSELMKGMPSSKARRRCVACSGWSTKSAPPARTTMLCTAKRAGSVALAERRDEALHDVVDVVAAVGDAAAARSIGASISSASITGARRRIDIAATSARMRLTASSGGAAGAGARRSTRSASVSSSVHGLNSTLPAATRRPSCCAPAFSICAGHDRRHVEGCRCPEREQATTTTRARGQPRRAAIDGRRKGLRWRRPSAQAGRCGAAPRGGLHAGADSLRPPQ